MTEAKEENDDGAQPDPGFFRNVLNASPTPVMVLEHHDGGLQIVYVNPAFERRTGYGALGLRRRDWRLLCGHELDYAELQRLQAAVESGAEARTVIRSYCHDGTVFWSELHVAPLRPGLTSAQYVGVLHDITAEREQREQLEYRALHDELTGLPNRRLLQDRLDHAIACARSRDRPFGLVLLDLDGFKSVNDTLGHQAGDELLKAISARLTRVLRAGDTVARIGGDEFILLLESVGRGACMSDILTRLSVLLECPVSVGDTCVTVGCSMGVGWYPAHGTDAAALLRYADRSMYRQKVRNRSRPGFDGDSRQLMNCERDSYEDDSRVVRSCSYTPRALRS